jgi:hypothetical protein
MSSADVPAQVWLAADALVVLQVNASDSAKEEDIQDLHRCFEEVYSKYAAQGSSN